MTRYFRRTPLPENLREVLGGFVGVSGGTRRFQEHFRAAQKVSGGLRSTLRGLSSVSAFNLSQVDFRGVPEVVSGLLQRVSGAFQEVSEGF